MAGNSDFIRFLDSIAERTGEISIVEAVKSCHSILTESDNGNCLDMDNPVVDRIMREARSLGIRVRPNEPIEWAESDFPLLATLGSYALSGEHGPSDILSWGSFTDQRDGRRYNTFTIMGTEWMLENLRYDCGDGCAITSVERTSSIPTGYYTYEAAHRAMPDGWRLPTLDDWHKLDNLCSKGGRNSSDVLFDRFGFDLIGNRNNYIFSAQSYGVYEKFLDAGVEEDRYFNDSAVFWTECGASEYMRALGWMLNNRKSEAIRVNHKLGLNVRCVRI